MILRLGTLRIFLLILGWISISCAYGDSGTPSSAETRTDWLFDEDKKARVVQSRVYIKSHKLNLGSAYGLINNDPFLTTTTWMGWAGFNFNEYIAINVGYWRVWNTASPSLNTLVQYSGSGANNNPIQSILSGELALSLLYGKLTILGKSILHYDMHLLGGAGEIRANNGKGIAPMLGVGQQIFLSRFFSLRVDYRLYRFQESIVQLYGFGAGQTLGTRTNYTGVLTMGINLLVF
jgi:outer membrane beta-barrel protein